MKHLFKFYWDCGRQGHIEGLFISTEEDVSNKLIDKEINFGEVLGKHSEVHGIIESSDISIIYISKEALDELEFIIGDTVSGYNPFNHLKDEEDEI